MMGRMNTGKLSRHTKLLALFGTAGIFILFVYMECFSCIYGTKVNSFSRWCSTHLFSPYRYSYHPDCSDGVKTGHQFEVSKSLQQRYASVLDNYVLPSPSAARAFVFVMGVSPDVFYQSQDAVASVQRHFPEKKIYLFDWGLTKEQQSQVKTWCNVVYKYYDFSAGPSFISVIPDSSAWKFSMSKVFVILEALRQAPSVFWIDCSVRLRTADLTAVYQLAESNSGLVFFDRTRLDYSTFAVTPPAMYRYLPTSESKVKSAVHVQSGAMFIIRTKEVVEQVLWWLLLCSMDRHCIYSGTYNTTCDFQRPPHLADHMDIKSTFNRCSRFDQSVMNILSGNMFDFDLRRYCVGTCNRTLLGFYRGPSHLYNLRTDC